MSFRDAAPWFPEIPPEDLVLNENGFRRYQLFRSVPYRPMSYLHFGGPGGSWLKKVISISVWTIDHNILMGFDIEYDSAVCGSRIHTLGARGPFPQELCSMYNPKCIGQDVNPEDQRITIQIDGPNGERITRVVKGTTKFNL